MLNLIKSNRMENLAQALCAVIAHVPHDPMASEFIGIQSRGMKKWLSQIIAQQFGICSNIQFMFPRQLLEYVREVTGCIAAKGQDRVLDREMMAWAVLDILLPGSSDVVKDKSEFKGLAAYLKDDATEIKAMALSRKIASVLDDYQVYRPDMLSAWARAEAVPSGDDHALWQAEIWQALSALGTPLQDQMQACLAAFDAFSGSGKKLPERISLFGVSSLPPSFLELFYHLSRDLEVNLFLLTPTNQFFFDLPSRRQQEKTALQTGIPQDLDQGNPLLSALGQAGRETQGLLENFDYHEPFDDLFFDPVLDDTSLPDVPGTCLMLKVIQSDILNLVRRGPGGGAPPVEVPARDHSISIHACHSPMREAQVLKDLILEAFHRAPDLCPHDVVVMMPNIEAYAPFLEAVFSQEPRLPYTVSDRRRQGESDTLKAFFKLLDLKDSRLERSNVLDLLACGVIGDKFDLSPQDQALVVSLLDRAGVLWGKDAGHRESILGMAWDQNSWTFGLDRLMAGFALPEGEKAFMNHVFPCDGFEGLDADLLGRFAHYLHCLFHVLEMMEAPATPRKWAQRFKKIIVQMLAKDLNNDGDVALLLAALDDMALNAEKAGFEKEISFPAICKMLTALLDVHVSQGSFLSGSMTFCNLMPMRSIPFKLVCLMGMDTNSFPRTGAAPGFDLIRRYPRLGDKQERAEDCGLFLEALLCARQQVIITYTGKSISDNSPIPCASPVAELEETMESSFVFSERFQFRFSHPLHPFSPDYFDRDGGTGFFSYSKALCRICNGLQNAGHPRESDMGESGAGEPDLQGGATAASLENISLAEIETSQIELSTLIRFFRHPVQYYAVTTLNLNYPDIGEIPEEREPFRLGGLAAFQQGSKLVTDPDPESLFQVARAKGELPFGNKAGQEWARISDQARPVRQMVQELFPNGEGTLINLEIPTRFGTVSGQVDQVFDPVSGPGRAVAEFGKLSPKRLLTQWVMHLAYCAGQKNPGTTLMVGRDPEGKLPAVRFEYDRMAPDRAHALIEVLANLYVAGTQHVLPFFPDPCFYLVRDLYKRELDLSDESLEKALVKTAPMWMGSDWMQGEITNRYTALLFKEVNPFSSPALLKQSGVLETSLAVYRPLLEHLIQ